MRSYSQPDLRSHEQVMGDLFDELERASEKATPAELKASIGRTATLGAVLQARFLATASPTPGAGDVLPRFLAPKDAAVFLGISRSTLLRLVDSGKLRPSHPTEGSVRFDRRELEELMAKATAPRPTS